MTSSMQKKSQHWRWLWLFAALAPAVFAHAAGSQDPYQVVQQTTEHVIGIINEGKGYYDKEPQRFYRQVETVMNDVVDFDGFARGVMGTYANLQRASNEQEKAVLREQIKRFSDTFKQGLIETYAKGLLKFNGQRIETLPPRKGEDLNSGTVGVVQNIYGGADKPYVVQYTMRKEADGGWRVRNVIIEGINLGQTYRSQFASAADQNHGDIDKVIATWQVEPQTGDNAASGDKAKSERK